MDDRITRFFPTRSLSSFLSLSRLALSLTGPWCFILTQSLLISVKFCRTNSTASPVVLSSSTLFSIRVRPSLEICVRYVRRKSPRTGCWIPPHLNKSLSRA